MGSVKGTFFTRSNWLTMVILAISFTVFSFAKEETRCAAVIYQLGWTTLPGLRGLSVSEFRATPTTAPDHEKGVAVDFATGDERDEFLRAAEAVFAPRRFSNAADAFDTVKAYVLERGSSS